MWACSEADVKIVLDLIVTPCCPPSTVICLRSFTCISVLGKLTESAFIASLLAAHIFLLCSLRLKMALGLIYFVVADLYGGKVKKGVVACVGVLGI
jgi:hypothetical protein